MDDFASIRFYAVEPDCWYSRMVFLLGTHVGRYNMNLNHVAIELDGWVADFTSDGFGFYQVDEEEKVREPISEISIPVCSKEYYARLQLFASLGLRLRYVTLLHKVLHLPMGSDHLLCTDFVQLILGEMPQHYSPIQFYQELTSRNHTELDTWETF